MYCTKCGAEIANCAKFCSACGSPASVPVLSSDMHSSGLAQERTISSDCSRAGNASSNIQMSFLPIALHIKTGMLKREAAAMLINAQTTVFIMIGNDLYKKIVQDKGAGIEGGYFKKTAGMMTAFRDFVYGLSHVTLSEISAQYPAARVWNTQDIGKLRIHLDYDSANEQYSNEYTFDLHVGNERYKGALDPNMNFGEIKKPLKEMLGRKFQQ